RAHRPVSASRNVGTPESLDMPAPVVTTTQRAARRAWAAACTDASAVFNISGWSSLWKTPSVESKRGPARRRPREPRTARDNWLQSGGIQGRPQVPSPVRSAAARGRGVVHKNTHIGNPHLPDDADLLLLQPLLELLEQVHGTRDARRGQSLDGARREPALQLAGTQQHLEP